MNADLAALDGSKYDVYSLYHPFQEHQAGSGLGVIEQNIDLESKYFARSTSEVFRQLSWAKPGKMLITYHGAGAFGFNRFKIYR